MRFYCAYSERLIAKYATNEKMDAERILELIPDDWILKGTGSDTLLSYLSITLNDRLSKEHNFKIAKNIIQMEELNVENSFVKLQKAYVIVTPERICKVCQRKLAGMINLL